MDLFQKILVIFLLLTKHLTKVLDFWLVDLAGLYFYQDFCLFIIYFLIVSFKKVILRLRKYYK